VAIHIIIVILDRFYYYCIILYLYYYYNLSHLTLYIILLRIYFINSVTFFAHIKFNIKVKNLQKLIFTLSTIGTIYMEEYSFNIISLQQASMKLCQAITKYISVSLFKRYFHPS
jgi:hypothetical protein